MPTTHPERTPSGARLWLVASSVLVISYLMPGCQPRPAASPSAPLRVTTWNVHGCAAGIDKVIEELRHTQADVVCLQEAESPLPQSGQLDQASTIAERLGMRQFSAGSSLPGGNQQRMAILFGGELSAGEALDAKTGRIYGVTAIISWQGRRVRIVCVHLTSSYRLDIAHAVRSTVARNKEAEDLASRLRRWQEPVLIAGDFNATPGMHEHERLSRVAVRASTTQPTCPSDHPILAIDHIYHSPRLRARSCQVQSTTASDHLRVVAELSFSEPGNDRE